MSIHMKTKFEEFIADPVQRRAFEKESLTIDATELIAALMEQGGVNRTELARKLGTSKAHVSQVLSGARNMTLHTLADCLFALGHRAHIDAFPLEPRHNLQRSGYQFEGRPWTLLSRPKLVGKRQATQEWGGVPEEQPAESAA